MTKSSTSFALLLLGLLGFTVCSIGCGTNGPTGPETVRATGIVTYKDQPVAGAMILFQPATSGQGRTCQVQTDDTGRFEMVTGVPGGKPKPGAVPGEYLVGITKQELKAGQMAPTHLLPRKYMTPAKSKLTATVVDGQENEFELKLSD